LAVGRWPLAVGRWPLAVRGFTLIELLVVVVIIAILAAIAIPQYFTAVEKSRVSNMLTLLKSIDSAQKIYFLTTGNYTMNINDLDIQLPPGGKIKESECYQNITYKNFACLLRDKTLPPSNSSAYCNTQQTILEKYYNRNYFICWALKTDDKQNNFCKKLSGNQTHNLDTTTSYGFNFNP
jgi:prepilin-type N-terminal cleavage/methylation domain-containing protein